MQHHLENLGTYSCTPLFLCNSKNTILPSDVWKKVGIIIKLYYELISMPHQVIRFQYYSDRQSLLQASVSRLQHYLFTTDHVKFKCAIKVQLHMTINFDLFVPLTMIIFVPLVEMSWESTNSACIPVPRYIAKTMSVLCIIYILYTF